MKTILITYFLASVFAAPSITFAQQQNGATLGNANDTEWADLYCNQPGTIRNGSIACIEPKCQAGQIKKKGKCVAPTATEGTTVPAGVSGSTNTVNTNSNDSTPTTSHQPVSGGGTQPDEKSGCWLPDRSLPWCVVVTKQGNNSFGEFRVVYRNDCQYGVYMKFGNERKDGTWDGGADHLSPGKSMSWSTGGGTGKYKYFYTGSSKSSYDWVCAGKDPDYKNFK